MTAPTRLSRRSFLGGMTAGAIARGAHFLSASDEVAARREKLLLFRYSDVRLTGGPLKAQADRIHDAYLALDEDRLLKVYRQRAGLTAPGEDMGGWYDANGFGPGQVFGQILSALARFYNGNSNPATLAKVQRLVSGFAATIGPEDYWYPSVHASTQSAAYNLDKILIGLLDARQFAGVSSALDIARTCVRGSIRYLPDRAYERFEAPRQAVYDETYTLPENLLYLYESAGAQEYRALAQKYLMDRTYFDPLSRGDNVLPGLHAYSHVNALCSACRTYQVTGEPKYLRAAQNAFQLIEKTQSFSSGGWAPNEEFVMPDKGLLGESLSNTHSHFETPCGSYAHLKLMRYLLRFTGEARYGDSLERVLYNTVLGTKDPKGDGHVFYYSDYHSAARKEFHRDKWPCCSGTLPQVVADYSISAYFRDSQGICVNLFTPSEVTWQAASGPARLVQSTQYPEADSTQLRLELTSADEFTIYVRIPKWLQKPARISVNGKPLSVPAEAGTFASIRKRWQTNDVVEVEMPFSFRLEAIDEQHPGLMALMWGPLMMVALDGSAALSKRALDKEGPGLATATYPLSFQMPGPASVRFVPFYKVGDEAYTTYLQWA